METSLSTPPQLPNQMEEDASKYNEREGEGDGREEDEWAVLPDGEEKDEEMGMGNDADVFEGLNHAGDDDDDGGVSASGAANKVITAEECLKAKHPLHLACNGGASLDVIKYLVEEADGDKGKELLGIKDTFGMYPLHLACRALLINYTGASLEVIKYLFQNNPVPLLYKDMDGLNCLDYMNSDTLRAIWGKAHQIGSVADKPSDIDRLNYLIYARALVYAARQAEQPGTSLCIGLYGRYVAFTE